VENLIRYIQQRLVTEVAIPIPNTVLIDSLTKLLDVLYSYLDD
jgi:hypothetical protein